MEQIITPVILSGGSGTRLWPVSRAARPKQMQALTGSETLLQLTARRVQQTSLFAQPMVVASERHADEVEAQLDGIGAAPSAVILEPVGRNTAAAIALAALAAPADALLLVMPSDHIIQDTAAFTHAVRTSMDLAADGWLITFGIHAGAPETGYGYIRRGAPLTAHAFRVDRFVEKPDRETAARYLAEGGFDWNGGIFLMRADRYLDALARHAPDILAACRQAHAAAQRSGVRIRPDASIFARVRSVSIDYAVMERDDRVAVTPVEMGWCDIGSWDALYDIGAKDAQGNMVIGDVEALDSRDCLLRSDGPLVVTVGVDNLVVIATQDVVLILPKGETQRVKDAVAALQGRGHPSLET